MTSSQPVAAAPDPCSVGGVFTASARVADKPYKDRVTLSDHLIRGALGSAGMVAGVGTVMGTAFALGQGLIALGCSEAAVSPLLLIAAPVACVGLLVGGAAGFDIGGRAVTQALGRVGASVGSKLGVKPQLGAQLTKGVVALGIVAGGTALGVAMGVGPIAPLALLGCGAMLSGSFEEDHFD